VPGVQAPPPASFSLPPFVVTDLFPKNLYLKGPQGSPLQWQ
jgi:hypothetical protein